MSYSVEQALKEVSSIGEEIIGIEDLTRKFTTRTDHLKTASWIVFYDGFEPSGRLHIAQGLLRVHTINKIVSCGAPVVFKLYIADEFAYLNGKMGGDYNKIRDAGKLMEATWRACGLDKHRVEIIWASEEMKGRRDEYWKELMEISTSFNTDRIKRCMPALGKEEGDSIKFSAMLYAAMQAIDIPFLKVDVASMGMDQRKIIALNRDYSAIKKEGTTSGSDASYSFRIGWEKDVKE